MGEEEKKENKEERKMGEQSCARNISKSSIKKGKQILLS